MLEDAIGDEASKIAGACDQNPLQADAGAPPPLEQLAHDLARHVGEADGEDEEERPDQLRDLVGACGLRLFRGVVGLHVQRRPDAEHHGQDAADQHREEIVHARAAAAQAVDSLELEGHRRQHRHERQDADVVLDRRVAFRDRDQPALEPDAVREDERPHREEDVRHHVEGNEEAVVASYHRLPAGASIVSSMSARICCR